MEVSCFKALDYSLEFVLVGIIPDFPITIFFPVIIKVTGGKKFSLSCYVSN